MGIFDGAETCELVGSYILCKLTPQCGNETGLYKDDESAEFKKTQKIEAIKKLMCKICVGVSLVSWGTLGCVGVRWFQTISVALNC